MRFAASILSLAAGLTLAAGSLPASARGITVAVGSSFTTLDPYQATDLLSRSVAKSFYEGLYAFDKNLKPVPQLAKSHEVSPDGLSWTFTLQEGVKFHDGTEFNADAVKLNFERVLNPANHLSRYALLKFIDKVEVLGPYKVRFDLKSPMPSFLQRLAAQEVRRPRHCLQSLRHRPLYVEGLQPERTARRGEEPQLPRGGAPEA